ncbi:hypothetical protein PE36_05893 [Moritella sp. PE36]|nr:hypothetical protein PE36_05893 [Moritella sp. PE36]
MQFGMDKLLLSDDVHIFRVKFIFSIVYCVATQVWAY